MTALEKLESLVSTQCSSGNWDYNSYMHGMANGLILALATMKGEQAEPEFLSAPAEWLADRPRVFAEVASAGQERGV